MIDIPLMARTAEQLGEALNDARVARALSVSAGCRICELKRGMREWRRFVELLKDEAIVIETGKTGKGRG